MSYQRGQKIPSYGELKQILYRNPSFQPATILTLDSSNRNTNTPINNPTFRVPIPVKGTYAVSLKSLALPVIWPNVTSLNILRLFMVQWFRFLPTLNCLWVGIVTISMEAS